jgi:glutamate--cysteine ligase
MDWEDHLTTLFPEARVKRFIEMRGADSGPWSSLCALPAFWVGLLYDAERRKAKWPIISADWTQAERDALRLAVPPTRGWIRRFAPARFWMWRAMCCHG